MLSQAEFLGLSYVEMTTYSPESTDFYNTKISNKVRTAQRRVLPLNAGDSRHHTLSEAWDSQTAGESNDVLCIRCTILDHTLCSDASDSKQNYDLTRENK